MHIVFMGVTGSGKSTAGREAADFLNVRFVEGDDFHPPSNISKMTSGIVSMIN
jgi:carbohydrate kinase (thermoresistant glucokinase family)